MGYGGCTGVGAHGCGVQGCGARLPAACLASGWRAQAQRAGGPRQRVGPRVPHGGIPLPAHGDRDVMRVCHPMRIAQSHFLRVSKLARIEEKYALTSRSR